MEHAIFDISSGLIEVWAEDGATSLDVYTSRSVSQAELDEVLGLLQQCRKSAIGGSVGAQAVNPSFVEAQIDPGAWAHLPDETIWDRYLHPMLTHLRERAGVHGSDILLTLSVKPLERKP